MNTQDINDILFSDRLCLNIFRGVYARDEFINHRNELHQKGLYIINTDNSNSPGSHWVAFYDPINGKRAEYFDSYGRDVGDAELRSVMGRNLLVNKVPLQGITTNVCGYYCITYGLLRCRGSTMNMITSKLKKIPHIDVRDHAVKDSIVYLFKDKTNFVPKDIHLFNTRFLYH